MNDGVMGTIGAVIGLVMNWGAVAESAIGAGVGAVVAITINESWKWIKRYRSKKAEQEKSDE